MKSNKLNEVISYKTIVENIVTPSLVFLCNDNLDILCINQKLIQLFDCETEAEFYEFCDRSFKKLIVANENENPFVVKKDKQVIQQQEVFCVVSKNGRKIDIKNLAVVLGTEDQQAIIFDQLIENVKQEQNVFHDQLTGLYSRSSFYNRANQILCQAEQNGNLDEYAIVYNNIRNFKYYNMKYGRQSGDTLLQNVANKLNQLQSHAIVARFGDDHFISFFKIENGTQVFDCINKDFDTEFANFGLKLKTGIYKFNKSGISAEIAGDLAKIACDSINDSMNSVRLYDEKLESQLNHENIIEKNFNTALKNEYIKVYYQPVIRTINEKFCGAEALARWIDPELGFLSPNEFIPVLEKKRLIKNLDLYVINQICKDIKKVIQLGYSVVPISFNLSKLDFIDDDIFEAVDKIVLQNEIARDLIIIEITESAVLIDPNQLKKVVSQFREAGYQVWMDDFGSELSSLNVLSEYHFDEIKLDMLFLRTFNNRSKELIRSIIQMAKRLGIQTLAEGVETYEQYKYLQEIGCEKVQGYYFSKPIPLEEILKFQKQSGLKIESRAMRQYYNQMGRIDHITDRPLAIVESDGKKFYFVYVNAEFERICKQIGNGKNFFTDYIVNAQASTLKRKFWDLQKETQVSDSFCEMDFSIYGKYFRLRSKCIATHQSYAANQVEIQNLTLEEDESKTEQLDYIFRTMYSMYDSVLIMNSNGAFTNVLKSENTNCIHNADIDREEIKAKHIFIEDQSEFMDFTNPSTIKDRLRGEERGYETRYLRTKTENGAYIWKAHTIQYIPDGDLLIYSTRPAFFHQNNLINRLVPSYVEEYKQGFKGLLSSKLYQSNIINLFWKDKDRRFIGVNQKFLNTFGFDSDKVVIGKNDEEMFWHVDDLPFRQDEMDVLEKGITIKNRLGKCIIKGVLHTILVSKEPIYQDGQIIGLIGYFINMDELSNANENYKITSLRDHVTGLLSAQGMTNSLSDYLEAWSGRKENFAVIQVEFKEFDRGYATYGNVIVKKMGIELSDILVKLCGNQCSIARLYAGTFSILRKYKDQQEIDDFVNLLQVSMKRIHSLANYPATLNPVFHVEYTSTQHNIHRLALLATGGVVSETKNFEERLLEYSEIEETKLRSIANLFGEYLDYTKKLHLNILENHNVDEQLLSMLDFQMNMLKSLTKIYLSVHIINVKEDSFMRISCASYIHKILKRFTSARKALEATTNELIHQEYKEGMKQFLDFSTLADRLKQKNVISFDFDGTEIGWCRASFTPVSYNDDGSLKEVIFFTQHIQSEKEREDKIQALLEFKLEDVWNTYEEIGDMFYAADMDTHELLYVNRIVRDLIGVTSLDDVIGKKCYEVIQGKSAPCDFCTNKELMCGKPIEYDFFNTKYNVMVHIRDQRIVHNQKNIRIEHAIEIDNEKGSQDAKKAEHTAFVVNESIRLALEEIDANDGIEKLLAYLGAALEAERTYIFELTANEKGWTNSYEWCAKGIKPEKDFLSYVPIEDTELWNREFNKGNYIKIRNIEDIKETDPTVYEYLIPQNIHSLIVSPIYLGTKLYGFVGFDNPPSEMIDILAEKIKVISHVISSLLDRRILKEKLDKIVYVDEMTGLGNRHAVERFFTQIHNDKSIGLVFCDVCGLKFVNDNVGHLAGDNLIHLIEDIVKTVFRENDIYRWGGDEILILVSEIPQDEFYRRCEYLKEKSLENDVPLAVGSVWKPNVNDSYEKLLEQADKKMYAHKNWLYQKYDILNILKNNNNIKS